MLGTFVSTNYLTAVIKSAGTLCNYVLSDAADN